ncbi:hypothetical protein P3X46_026312 [Hevea brasiliensis]|uniref:DUF4283 domain-containing protein n=1 Tax=Hevea brasiliensis TaxID=3981 RepID=A0ABQ9KX64_HEVBR|nr:hypothetical protein P3X46_026312 [Hevea brasiliensis]
MVWVQIPDLPIEYFNKSFLLKVGNKIGRTVPVDDTTLQATQGKYARVCVEVDLSKSLLLKFCLRHRIKRIEYKGVHQICFSCNCYGHWVDECKLTKEDNCHIDENVAINPNMVQNGLGDENPITVRITIRQPFLWNQ